MVECLHFKQKDIEKVKWSNGQTFFTHTLFLPRFKSIIIYINKFIYIIIEVEVRKIWGVLKKCLTI